MADQEAIVFQLAIMLSCKDQLHQPHPTDSSQPYASTLSHVNTSNNNSNKQPSVAQQLAERKAQLDKKRAVDSQSDAGDGKRQSGGNMGAWVKKGQGVDTGKGKASAPPFNSSLNSKGQGVSSHSAGKDMLRL